MRDVEFLPAWYARQHRIRFALIVLGSCAAVAALAVIALAALR
jgi:hypothetical protein